MDSVTFETAKAELSRLLDKVSADATPIEIIRPNRPSAILISKAEYGGMIETLYLQSTPANAARLHQGRLDIEAGKYTFKVIVSVNDEDAKHLD